MQGNRLTNVARRMKASASLQTDDRKKIANRRFNNETLESYRRQAHKQAKREQLTQTQKTSILADWTSRRGKGRAREGLVPAKLPDEEGSRHIEDIQSNARYVGEILSEVAECDPDNVIHAVKVRRLADAHAKRAKSIRDQLRAEVRKAKAAQNSCKRSGVKSLSAAV